MSYINDLARHFDLKRIGDEYRGTCPSCGYKNAFAVREHEGKLLWWCAACHDGKSIGKAVHAAGYQPQQRQPRSERSNPIDKILFARRLIEQSREITDGDPVARYLDGRHLQQAWMTSICLRFHPRLKHTASGQFFPGMLALILRPDLSAVAAHRTFLTPEGQKAPVEPVKMTIGPIWGNAVRLGEVTDSAPDHIVVAEGIETAAAAMLLLQLPAWSAISAGNLAKGLILPPEVRQVTIAADNDPPGIEAAQTAATRWQYEGREAKIVSVDAEGADFADLRAEREAKQCK